MAFCSLASTTVFIPVESSYLFMLLNISQIILWDFRQNVALTKCHGHETTVSDVTFYPVIGQKGYPLLLSAGDYTTRMWHPLLESSKELVKLKQHNFGAEVC